MAANRTIVEIHILQTRHGFTEERKDDGY